MAGPQAIVPGLQPLAPRKLKPKAPTDVANEPYNPNQKYKASPSYQVPGSKANEKAPRNINTDGGEGPSTATLLALPGKPRSKKPLNPVIDKRTVKQKLADAQARRN